MTGKPKNRRINLTRGRQRPPQEQEEDHRSEVTEIPRASKVEIRTLIEVDGLCSTTEIAKRLNADRLGCAQADRWTAKLVDSALRRNDMSDLKEKLRENRSNAQEAPTGASILEIKQAVDDTVRAALSDYGREALKVAEVKMPEIPPLKVDTFSIKGAVADAVGTALEIHLKQKDKSTGLDRGIADRIQRDVKAALSTLDLQSVKRVTEATGRNVGDIHTRIDATCEDLHDTMVEGLKDQKQTVVDTCESMAVQLSEQVDKRIDKLEDTLVTKLVSDKGLDLEEALGRIVDARLKQHLDSVVNQFAVMVGDLKKSLRKNGR